MLALEETNPTAARACRQDPNGHGTGWYLQRLNLGEHAMDLPQVKGGPEDESYVFNNLFAVESHTPQVIPRKVLKAWKTRVAPEDCRAELSDNVRGRVLQKVKQLPLSMTGCEIALSEGQRGDGRIWYRGRVPASKTKGLFYEVHARLDFKLKDGVETATALDVQCTQCAGGLRGACTHAGTFAEIVCSLHKRAAVLTEMRELIVTDGSNSWDRVALDREAWDPKIPVHEQTYEGTGRTTERGSTKRRVYQEHEFDPRTAEGRSAKRGDDNVASRRLNLLRLLRRDAWANRQPWSEEPLSGQTGEEEIAGRHASGLPCRLAVDIYEGSSDVEYDYSTAEGWPAVCTTYSKAASLHPQHNIQEANIGRQD